MDMPLVIASGMFMTGSMMLVGLKTRQYFNRLRRPDKKPKDSLDAVLFHWDDENTLTVRNLLGGGLHAFGRTDGGKTSSLRQVAHAILCSNSSLLVLCAKRGEYRDWLSLARSAGREADVVLIDPQHEWRFNMIGSWMAGKAVAENMVRFIMELKSVVFRESQTSGGESAVWRKYDETALRNAVILLLSAGEVVTATNLHKLIIGAPTSPAEIDTDAWRRGYCNEVIRRGYEADLPKIKKMDIEQAMDYWLRVWPCMGDRTRGSVLMGVTGTLAAMNVGLARELFGEQTNITPREAIEGRKIVIVNMPPDEYGDVGLVANIGWKYLWQKEVLQREIGDDSPIAGVWGDESSLWVSDFDADYLSRCRSYRGFQVYICQSRANYEKCLPADKAEAVVESLLNNFSHRLYFALGSSRDAEQAADLCGKELQILGGGGVQHQPYNFIGSGNDSHSSSFHEQYEYLVRPEEFMTGLRTGSPANDYLVDAILIRSGKPFSNGLPVLRVTFDQRRT